MTIMPKDESNELRQPAEILYAAELDALLVHFRSDVGRKQAMIVDHTVSTRVMATLSFSGKLKDIPGAQEERNRMQAIWNKEDDEMRFSIQDASNADAQGWGATRRRRQERGRRG